MEPNGEHPARVLIVEGHPNQITTFQNPDDAEIFVSRGVVPEERTVVTPGSGVDPDRFEDADELARVPWLLLRRKSIRRGKPSSPPRHGRNETDLTPQNEVE